MLDSPIAITPTLDSAVAISPELDLAVAVAPALDSAVAVTPCWLRGHRHPVVDFAVVVTGRL